MPGGRRGWNIGQAVEFHLFQSNGQLVEGFGPEGPCMNASGKIPSVRVRNALEGPRASQERLLQEAA